MATDTLFKMAREVINQAKNGTLNNWYKENFNLMNQVEQESKKQLGMSFAELMEEIA